MILNAFQIYGAILCAGVVTIKALWVLVSRPAKIQMPNNQKGGFL